ncbi:cytochrome c3 family protein [Ideonella sp.]|uniref:cytochrome c3 family protein n=1 Tax=Ideonella sp. TaxID=1929293 RepID=UPI003BB53E89
MIAASVTVASSWLAALPARLAALLALLIGTLLIQPALGQGLESALSPGPLTQAHAKWQNDCASCHVRFDRAGQDKLCLDCHKPVAADLRDKTGWHGRQKPQACRSCHTDHKGRDVKIAPLDTRQFDHSATDWPLRAAHGALACTACHREGKAWREAPQACSSCHGKDDVHKGGLGAACADCHTERSWKEARFDHSRTRFALKDQHAQVGCQSCHKDQHYRDTPSACVACHRADDKHKGRYGERCESCHDAKVWKSSSFNHDAETRYPLRGKHRAARCDSCHTGKLYGDKPATDCVACHRKDDKHQASLGTECAACHSETSWKAVQRFDHDRSRFPLLGQHEKAECKSCHQTDAAGLAVYRNTPTACVACHRRDDKHEKTLGEACGACHGERSWKIGRFDHSVSRFALQGAHAAPAVQCSACHTGLTRFRDTPRDCIGCHRQADKHAGQLGERCDSCHNDRRWKETRFDHGRARFALLGAHVKLECKACHASPRYRDAPSDCLGCHRKDDQHRGRLGERCDSCHNARHWSLVQFDHTRQTSYPLTGRHTGLACDSCHRSPAPAGRKTAALGSDCVDCHRAADPHDGQFGTQCATCHQTSDWRSLLPRRPPVRSTGKDLRNSGTEDSTKGALP